MTDYAKTTMAVAGSAMRAQSLRVRLASENLANVESPEYRRRTVQFAVTNPTDNKDVDFVAIKSLRRDTSDFTQKYDPTNPMADKNGYIKLSNVNIPLVKSSSQISSVVSYVLGRLLRM